jgi:hypothetical protein
MEAKVIENLFELRNFFIINVIFFYHIVLISEL